MDADFCEDSVKHANVSGGGVAGLGAAIALAMRGWAVDVYERSSAIREIGAGIFIKANSLRVLRSFGCLDHIKQGCVALRGAQTFTKNGELLQRRVLHHSNPVWTIQRQHLIRALYDRATALGVRIHSDCPVVHFDPDGAIMVKGKTIRSDLVVAADGVNSTARRTLGLDRFVRLPLSGAVRFLVPREENEADDVVREFWSGRLRVGVAPCTATDVFCYLVAPLSDNQGRRCPIEAEYWAERFPKLASERLFERAKKVECVHHPYPFVSTTSWCKGRVALVGDAAHALPPTLGQGAGLTLTNALLLSEYVSNCSDVPRALRAWQREWRWVSDRTQRWSRRYDWLTSECPTSLYPVRNTVIWAIGKSARFNSYMRVADRVDAPGRRVLPARPLSSPR
jgi:2-polyprenyl-6-methoxyphenol hydroxylase-like FAD-dependent oxidoreductase